MILTIILLLDFDTHAMSGLYMVFCAMSLIYFQVDPRFSVEIKGRISYDETDKRYRVIEEIEQASARDFYDTILLFNEVSIT